MLPLISPKDIERLMPFVGAMNEKSMGRLMGAINEEYSRLVETTISATIADGISEDDHTPLAAAVRDTCILNAFLRQIRSRDLILTDTGFGIVSSQNVAPASQARVDALKEELEKAADRRHETLVLLLRKEEGWGDTEQAKRCISTLFWQPSLLMGDHAGKNGAFPDKTFRLWMSVMPDIRAAESFLKTHLSEEFYEELLAYERQPSEDAIIYGVTTSCKRFIAAKTSHRQKWAEGEYEDLMNYVERNIEHFPTYANSEAYKLNHHEPYKNEAHHPGFFFG